MIHPFISLVYLFLNALFSLAWTSVLIPLIAAVIGPLNGSLQKEGGSMYARRCT